MTLALALALVLQYRSTSYKNSNLPSQLSVKLLYVVWFSLCSSFFENLVIIIELYLTRVKHIDYWSPSSFHNGPPTIKIVKHIDSLINYLYDLPTKFT